MQPGGQVADALGQRRCRGAGSGGQCRQHRGPCVARAGEERLEHRRRCPRATRSRRSTTPRGRACRRSPTSVEERAHLERPGSRQARGGGTASGSGARRARPRCSTARPRVGARPPGPARSRPRGASTNRPMRASRPIASASAVQRPSPSSGSRPSTMRYEVALRTAVVTKAPRARPALPARSATFDLASPRRSTAASSGTSAGTRGRPGVIRPRHAAQSMRNRTIGHGTPPSIQSCSGTSIIRPLRFVEAPRSMVLPERPHHERVEATLSKVRHGMVVEGAADSGADRIGIEVQVRQLARAVGRRQPPAFAGVVVANPRTAPSRSATHGRHPLSGAGRSNALCQPPVPPRSTRRAPRAGRCRGMPRRHARPLIAPRTSTSPGVASRRTVGGLNRSPSVSSNQKKSCGPSVSR